MENSYLIVNGYRLDLEKGVDIPITRSIADVMNPGERQKSQTKTFMLAGTQRNLKFFQSAFSMSWAVQDGSPIGVNYDISQLYVAEYYFQGKLSFRGALQLMNVAIVDGVYQFEVVLFSQIVSVFQQWGDLKLSELDWSKYDHTLNETNIQNSWDTSVVVNGTPTSNFTAGIPDAFGYLYAPVDYGFTNVLDKFKDNDIIPQVYFKEIVEKAFEYLGYSVDDTFIGLERFKRLVLGYGGGDKFQLSASDITALAYNLTADGSKTDQSTVNPSVSGLPVIYQQAWFNFQTGNSDYSILTIPNDPSSQVTTGVVTVPKTGTYRIEVTFTMDYEVGFPDATVSTDAQINYEFGLRFYKNFGYQTVTTDSGYATISEVAPTTGSWVVNKSFDVFLEAGDEYQLVGSHLVTGNFVGSGNTYQGTYLTVDYNSTITIAQSCLNSEIVNGDTVYLSSVLPDMKVTEFMTGITNHFGLNISEPDPDGVVYIEPWVDYYTDNSDNDIWTKKIDFDSPVEIEPIAINQPKQFKWKFAQDLDYYRKIHMDLFGVGYGDYSYENPSFFAKGEQVYELPYTITPPVERTGSDLIIPRVIDMTNGVVKPFKGKPRIYYFQGTDTQNWTLVNSDTLAETSQTTLPLLHHLDDTTTPTFDLCFGTPQQVFYTATDYTTVNSFTEYLEQRTLEVTSVDSKLLRASFYLSEEDSKEETLSRVKNIDGILYRVNQIQDYVSGKPTMVELVKILEVRNKGTYNIAVGISAKQGQFDTYNSTDTEYNKRTTNLTAGVTVSMEFDQYDLDTSTGEKTVTLDNRVLRDNYWFSVRKTAGDSDVVISVANSKTLNGETEVRITQVGTSLHIKWDGSKFTIN